MWVPVTAGIACWDHRSQVKNIEETSTGCLNLAAPLFGLTICRTGRRCFLNVVFLGSVIPGPNLHCVNEGITLWVTCVRRRSRAIFVQTIIFWLIRFDWRARWTDVQGELSNSRQLHTVSTSSGFAWITRNLTKFLWVALPETRGKKRHILEK